MQHLSEINFTEVAEFSSRALDEGGDKLRNDNIVEVSTSFTELLDVGFALAEIGEAIRVQRLMV